MTMEATPEFGAEISGHQRSLQNLRPPWQKGVSGNPAGRPKGARNNLAETFLADLAKDWAENGACVIAKVREIEPAAYLKIVASLVPREDRLEIFQRKLHELSLEEARQLLAMFDQAEKMPVVIEGTCVPDESKEPEIGS
jgi:hypothetical protein